MQISLLRVVVRVALAPTSFERLTVLVSGWAAKRTSKKKANAAETNGDREQLEAGATLMRMSRLFELIALSESKRFVRATSRMAAPAPSNPQSTCHSTIDIIAVRLLLCFQYCLDALPNHCYVCGRALVNTSSHVPRTCLSAKCKHKGMMTSDTSARRSRHFTVLQSLRALSSLICGPS